VNPAGGMTKIWYDLNDNVTKVEDELGRQSNMVYDNMDQVISARFLRGLGKQELLWWQMLACKVAVLFVLQNK
jgi:YD repeat-containing protein